LRVYLYILIIVGLLTLCAWSVFGKDPVPIRTPGPVVTPVPTPISIPDSATVQKFDIKRVREGKNSVRPYQWVRQDTNTGKRIVVTRHYRKAVAWNGETYLLNTGETEAYYSTVQVKPIVVPIVEDISTIEVKP